MALDLSAHAASLFDQLRYSPTPKRVRASYDDRPVLDTRDAYLVWEPRRVVPMYGVPPGDVLAELTPCPTPEVPGDLPPVLGPARFGWHFHDGGSFTMTVAGKAFEAQAFAPADPDLDGRLVVDWAPFDWVEEEEPVTGHPHDPFKRLDVLPSSRHVVVRLGDQVLADTTRAVALYETGLPVRWYVPADDVRTDLLTPSEATSTCAYKGHASYFSLAGSDDETVDLAWTYRAPLHEAAAVKDLLCFYAERTDLTVDGVDVPRPDTLWRSRRQAEHA
ncbi:MAG: DUF427 domain-containing protein [Nocardioidaceae bacterium]|nr:DUF427 domain-containing protein [Nocardioidaceae bacterium]NUS52107.1 DUF427 domain-containing protein [Nocardioidaceae bacterium]